MEIFYEDFKDNPIFSVGDKFSYGESNEFDTLALRVGIKSNRVVAGSYVDVYQVVSGFKIKIVSKIRKSWKPKENSGINSWLSNKDYSNNSNFEEYWKVEYEYQYQFYKLTDFLNLILDKIEK